MGKGWSKGLTAATDPRVARNAAAHWGMTYRRHLPPGLDKRYRGPARTGPIAWTNELAYAAGLIATDGCLVDDGRHIAFTSKDHDLMETFLGCVGHVAARISLKTGLGIAYQAQLGDAVL